MLKKIGQMATWPKIIGLRELAHLIRHQEQQTFIIIEILLTSQKPLKGGLKSESDGGFSIAIINIPFYYSKLLRPVHGIHGIDKLIIYFNTL